VATFPEYVDALRQLTGWQRQQLPKWSSDLAAFVDLTDGIVGEGLLCGMANAWERAPQVIEVLRLIGGVRQSELLQHAVDVARERGHVPDGWLDYDAAREDQLTVEAFDAAQQAIESAWEELWAQVEAYARASIPSAT
jgi:hypothetical protein